MALTRLEEMKCWGGLGSQEAGFAGDLPVTLRETLILYRSVRIAARCSMSAMNLKMFIISNEINSSS